MENKKYNLIIRTEEYCKKILSLAKKVPRNSVTFSLISQFVRSGTSVGANYCEADNAESKSDFRHKIDNNKKESKETIFWMRMLLEVCPDLSK